MNTYLTGALLLAVSGVAFAQNYEKNHLPCVAEVCIGDGLDALGKISWERARGRISFGGKPNYVDANNLTTSQLSGVKQIFRGNVVSAAPYLSYESFDAKGLPLLSGVTAACSRKELTGSYTTQSRNPTTVYISLVPNFDDPAKQSWRVVMIVRKFPEAKSNPQIADVQKQLDERYGKFKTQMGNRRAGTANYESKRDFDGMTLYLSWYRGVKEQESYMLNAACGGTKKPSVD